MVQSKALNLISKVSLIEKDGKEVIKLLYRLCKIVGCMRRKQFGRSSDLAINKIEDDNLAKLLQSAHDVDKLILDIQHLLNQCSAHSTYVQKQLHLRKV